MKRKVQDYIKKGELTFEDEDVPNVNGNPLSNHGRPKVNAVENSQEMQVKRDVRDVCMPMRMVYEALVEMGWLEKNTRKRKRDKRSKKMFLSVPQEHYRSLYLRTSRIP